VKVNTLEHLFHVHAGVVMTCRLYGADINFLEELGQRLDQIVEYICLELNIEPTQAVNLLPDTPLPPVAEEKFITLREWLVLQDSRFQWVYSEAIGMSLAEQHDLEPPTVLNW